ncbi:MAG TPA: putative lipid II flippase FtsW [Actinomycetota bacterium]
MSTAAARKRRPRHLRLVEPEERASRSPSRAERNDRHVTMLVVSTAALTLLGLIMVLSASSVEAYARFGSSFLFFNRQVVYAVVGSLAMAVTMRMRHRAWERLAGPMLLLSVVLLAMVLLPGFGTVAGGSARWIELGPVTIQPSEFAKLSVVAFGAALLSRRWHRIEDLRQLAVPLLPVAGVVCGLILLQPDLGTAVIIVTSVFVLLVAAGARMRHLLVGAFATGTVGLGLIYVEGYRWSRFVSYLDPWADPQGSGYQVIQSLIAITSGGPFGVGLGASRQKWQYVPNAHTDFIYSIIGEELGLAGMLVVLGLFAVLVYAGIRVAIAAPDAFSRLLAAGIVGWIGGQALINLGAVTGLLPITGVPLPFVSFGGSSLVVSLAAVGILASIARRGRAERG